MEDKQFNNELNNLLRSEAVKEQYRTESLGEAREELLTAFQNHYVALTVSQKMDTVEDIFPTEVNEKQVQVSEEDTDVFDDKNIELYAKLDELLEKDLLRYPELASGEVKLSGEGLYIHLPQPEEVSEDRAHSSDILEGGAVLFGDIDMYAVESFVSYNSFLRLHYALENPESEYHDDVVECPDLLLYMTNTVVVEADGVTSKHLGDVVVPMSYKSLKLEKVIRQSADIVKEKEPEPVPLITHFTSDFITEIYRDAENDLNYNERSQEDERESREDHQAEINIYMNGIDKNLPLILSAFDSVLIGGKRRQLTNDIAYYLEAVFIKATSGWRIAHAFLVQDDKGTHIVHVLPNDITKVDYK